MQQKSLVSYNIGLAGHPQFVFAVVNVYRDTTILVWHDAIYRTYYISCGMYLGIHRCIFALLQLRHCFDAMLKYTGIYNRMLAN